MRIPRCVGLIVFLIGMSIGLPLRAAADAHPFFPIMVWDGVPADSAQLSGMKACGITLIGFVAPKDIDRVHAAGMRSMVNDARASGYDWAAVDEAKAKENITSLVKEVGDKPGVYGYFLDDEPNAAQFAGLGTVSRLLHEIAPSKIAFVNLLPNYATAGQLGTATYPEYLEKFAVACSPAVFCYDHYALLDNGTLREEYWANLEAMRAAAIKHNIPFWNTVLSCAHFSYREPTAADFLFQAYTTLAYGGRGLAYFKYFAPEVGNYRASPIDQFGHQTPTYGRLRRANLEVLKLAPTILKLTSTKVYHFSKTPGCSLPPVDSLLSSAGGANFMAGEFRHEDGSTYVMIVNKDVTHSAPVNPQFRKPVKKIQMVSPYSGQLIDFNGEQGWLAPGQGVLLRIEQ